MCIPNLCTLLESVEIGMGIAPMHGGFADRFVNYFDTRPWSQLRGSNPQRPVYETGILAIEIKLAMKKENSMIHVTNSGKV